MKEFGTTNTLATIVLVGFLAVGPALFLFLPKRRALIGVFLLGWLFLPYGFIPFKGLPDLTKPMVVSIAALIGVALFDFGRLLRFKPGWFDLPMVVWCVWGLVSSVANQSVRAEMGWYDGFSSLFANTMIWAVPYLLGRVYFTDAKSVRELALGVVVGGLIYMPLCLWEMRMAPTLHRNMYGYFQNQFLQHIRAGGYRPMVFMQHGLMVAMWMTWAALVCGWLWLSGAMREWRGVPMWALTAALGLTAIGCRSVGAMALFLMGIAMFWAMRWTGTKGWFWALVIMIPCYMGVRALGLWEGEQAIGFARVVAGDARADSLAKRIYNERLLVDRALLKPITGWGGWDDWRVKDVNGNDISVSDGMWVIAVGRTGVVGLAALTLMVLIPPVVVMRRCPSRGVTGAAAAPAIALAVALTLWCADNLANAMVNPYYLLTAGALLGLAQNTRGGRVRSPRGDRAS